MGEGGASFRCRLEENLLPVFLSLTAPGLNPNSPPIEGWGGFAACLGCSGGLAGPPEEGGVYFLTPPIGGGGGGGGGAPPVQELIQDYQLLLVLQEKTCYNACFSVTIIHINFVCKFFLC